MTEKTSPPQTAAEVEEALSHLREKRECASPPSWSACHFLS